MASYIIYSIKGKTACRVDGDYVPQASDEYAVFPCEPDADPYDSAKWQAKYEAGLDLEDRKALKLREIASVRYDAETAGIRHNGMFVATDRQSQALLTGAALQAMLDPNYECQWKVGSGFITLKAQNILTLAKAVREHVQACFNREAALTSEIQACKTLAEVEAVKCSDN